MLEVINVSKSYGKNKVIKSQSIHFEAGKVYALTGPSGCGKSTLLNLLARLEKPSQGEVLLRGENIWKIKEQVYFSRHLGYVFQNYALIDEETVWQNLRVFGKKETVEAALEKVGLTSEYLNYKIFELSGGQAQRVAIARLLLKKADIILADEPTGALDAENSQEILNLLLGLSTRETLVVIATHDPNVYSKVDEVIHL